MSPARDERRQAVLGLLATHAAVQWNGRGQDIAFADEVLELAARLGRVEDVPAMRPIRVATDAERKKHFAAIQAVFERKGSAIATTAPSGDAQGERAHRDDTAAQRGSQGDTGGRA